MRRLDMGTPRSFTAPDWEDALNKACHMAHGPARGPGSFVNRLSAAMHSPNHSAAAAASGSGLFYGNECPRNGRWLRGLESRYSGWRNSGRRENRPCWWVELQITPWIYMRR
jgi:hypothetical protein